MGLGLELDAIAERLGVEQSKGTASGDGRNGLEMLRWAGRGMASVEVQGAADDVTEMVERDAVAMELARWL